MSPVKAKAAEVVEDPPSSRSSPVLMGDNAPPNSCQKLTPPVKSVPQVMFPLPSVLSVQVLYPPKVIPLGANPLKAFKVI